MFANALKNLDSRRWFDRMFPQTLAIAMFLLYVNGAFSLLNFLDQNGVYGLWRVRGGIGSLAAFVLAAAYVAGPYLMANGKLLGWYVSIGAAIGPLALRIAWKLFVYDGLSFRAMVVGDSYVSLAFEAALVALLVHPMSRSHVSRWLR